MTFAQDNYDATTLTQDDYDSSPTLSQDTFSNIGLLWTNTMLPWQLQTLWGWEGNGDLLTLDTY
jgi:hypothetical protein